MGDEALIMNERQGAERARREDVFYRRVVEGMRCGILTLNASGELLTVNELGREILEVQEPIKEARPVRDVLAHHPRLAQVLLDALSMSHLPNRAELELRTRADDGRTIGFTVSHIQHELSGEVEGLAVFFKDLTQVEQREEQERLRDRLAALGQMAASMAHEIRNPLASIDVTATLLRRKLDASDEGAQRLVAKILDEIERLNETVTQGLEFARSISPERVRQPLAPLLDSALAEAESRFPGHGVTIERHFDDATPEVPIDRNFVQQVFVNLAVNAFQAMESRGTLRVTVRPVARPDLAAHAAEVLVADDGPGIPAEVRDKLFYPFVTTKKQGSGIGLAMARKIIECHDGFIDVTSELGEGTTFRVRLPALGGE